MKRLYLFVAAVLITSVLAACAIVFGPTLISSLFDGSWEDWRVTPEDSSWLEVIGELASIAAGAAAVIGIVMGVIHRLNRDNKGGDQSEPTEPQDAPEQPAAPAPQLSESDSITIYLDSLSRSLRASAIRERFVQLSALAEEESQDLLPLDLVQAFECHDNDERVPVDLLTAHRTFDRFVLLGDPGSGKTTCLQRLALDLIEHCRAEADAAPIPIFCSLARWTDKRLTALDFLRQSVEELVGPGNCLPQLLSTMLENGRLVVIFDGLNEMPYRSRFRRDQKDELRSSKREQLAEDLATGQLMPRNIDSRERSLRELARSHGVRSRFIISCRTHEFSGSVAWTRVQVLPMTDEQIPEFLRCYLDEERASDLAGILADRPALWELARNPFYLALITKIAEDDLATVDNRGQLLRLLVEILVRREKQNRPEDEEVDELRFVRQLACIAFKMIKADMIGSQVDLQSVGTLDQESRALGVGTGVLLERDGAVVFRHQLFQEFFAAMALHRRHVRPSLGRLLRNKKWVETVILYQGISDEPQRSLDTIRRLLRQRIGLTLRPTMPPLFLLVWLIVVVAYGFVTANLLFDLVVGGGFWLDLARSHWVPVVIYFALPLALYFLAPAICYHRPAIINTAYVLARINSPETVDRIVEDLVLAFDRVGFAGRRKIAEPLKEIGQPAVPILLEGLTSEKPAVRRGCIETLGMMQEPRAIDPLITILRYGDHRFFPVTVGALARYDDDRCREEIAKSLQTFLPELGATAIALTTPTLIPTFGAAFQDSERDDDQFVAALARFAGQKEALRIARHLAISALGSSGHPSGLPTLAAIAQDQSDPLCKLAINSLASIDSEETVDVLISIIEEGGPMGRRSRLRDAAIQALSRLTSPKAVPKLTALLDHQRWWIHDAALNALGFIRDPACVPAILDRLHTLRDASGVEAAQALGRIGGDSAFDGLLTLAHDDRERTRVAALTYLDMRYPDRSGPALVKLLREPSYPGRAYVLKLLANAPPPGDEFRQVLLKLQRDPDRAISSGAMRIYRHLDRGLEERMKRIGVRFSTGGMTGWWQSAHRWMGWERYGRLMKEAELADETANASSSFVQSRKVMELATTDPEIGRQIRPVIRTFIAMYFIALALVGALPVLIVRPLSALGGLVLTQWPWALVLLAVAVICAVIKLRNSRRSALRFFDFMVKTVVVICVLGLAVRYLPWLAWVATKSIYHALVWSGETAWDQRWVTGPAILVGIACALSPSPGNRLLGFLKGSLAWIGILLAVLALLGACAIYWQIALALMGLGLFVLILFRRRRVRRNRAQVRERLYHARLNQDKEKEVGLLPALETAAPQGKLEAPG